MFFKETLTEWFLWFLSSRWMLYTGGGRGDSPPLLCKELWVPRKAVYKCNKLLLLLLLWNQKWFFYGITWRTFWSTFIFKSAGIVRHVSDINSKFWLFSLICKSISSNSDLAVLTFFLIIVRYELWCIHFFSEFWFHKYDFYLAIVNLPLTDCISQNCTFFTIYFLRTVRCNWKLRCINLQFWGKKRSELWY